MDDFGKIKYIFIDVDDTLLDFSKCAEKAMLSAAAEDGLEVPDDFVSVFHKINNGLWLAVEKKELTAAKLHEIRWNTIFAHLGIDHDGIGFETLFRKYLDETAEKVDGADGLLEYLAGKYKLYAASNASLHQQVNRLKLSGLYGYFTDLYVSEDIGHAKPSAEFFDECFTRTGKCTKNKTVMIGDSLTADISGAADYGLKTVWFNKKNMPVPDDCKADKIVCNLSEIKKFL